MRWFGACANGGIFGSERLRNLQIRFKAMRGYMIHDFRSQQPHGQTDTRHEEVLATIPQRGDDTVLEIVMLHDTSGATTIELRYLVWGDGVGWYRQHTLKLDGTTARDLIQALGIVQRRMEHQAVESLGHKVIPFPRNHRQSAATA
jgi:hypothetical protein